MPDTSVSSLSNCENFTVSYTGGPGFPFPWPFGAMRVPDNGR